MSAYFLGWGIDFHRYIELQGCKRVQVKQEVNKGGKARVDRMR